MSADWTDGTDAESGDAVRGKMKITLVRSQIGRPKKQRRILKGLGLKKMQHSVVVEDNPIFRGMVNKVSHLVKVEPAAD